tara:strand:- start:2196 stop:2897 length:702 start_codon:yes stop_codon:yes gene_type:complete
MKRSLFVLVLLLTSCVNSSIASKNVFFKGTFLKIEKKITLTACNPHDIKKCFTRTYESSASSFLIKHHRDKSYFITAAHVCLTNVGKLARLPKFQKREEIYGVNIEGKKYTYRVVSTNTLYDLCLLSTARMNTKAYSLASKMPQRGEKIYNIAAPVGVFGRGLVPLFDGIYSGQVHGKAVYTLPATGGSSGSPILNSWGQVVGMVSAVTKGFNQIVISPTSTQIQEFIHNEKL